jgi:predicted nucleotidyltransferase
MKAFEHRGFFREDYDTDKLISFGNSVGKEKHAKPRDSRDLYEFLSGHLDKIDEVAYDVGILDNNVQLLIHKLYHKHKIIKFQTKLEGLFYTRNNSSENTSETSTEILFEEWVFRQNNTFDNNNGLLLKDTSDHIFMITGLEQEINFGGVKTFVTASEFLPVCISATADTHLFTRASDKLVTCYSVDPHITSLLCDNDGILKVGRFRFGMGRCKISTNDDNDNNDNNEPDDFFNAEGPDDDDDYDDTAP